MNATLAHIFRHPIKAHGREELEVINLIQGACLPWDRHWAVAHEAATLQPGWNSCANFTRGAKAPQLMAITSTLDETTKTVTLSHPDLETLTFKPDNIGDVSRFLDWVRPLIPENRAQSKQIVTAEHGMTDSDFPSISVLSLSSLAELSSKIGKDLSIHRWRGNLWISGAKPFAEFDWVGQDIQIGSAVLKIETRITRCKATTANPQTGIVDADTLGVLASEYGHRDFGVYATVVNGGRIAKGDDWSLRK